MLIPVDCGFQAVDFGGLVYDFGTLDFDSGGFLLIPVFRRTLRQVGLFISHSTSIRRPRVGRVDLARIARGRDRCPGFLAVLGVTGTAVMPSADVTTLGAATARRPLSPTNRWNSSSRRTSSAACHTSYVT